MISFIHVVESKSFTAAAKRLNVSKSIISQHVSALEKYLKVELLKRSTRKLDLTPDGQAFYQHIRSIPQLIDNGVEAINTYNATPSGTLSILMPPSIIPTLENQVIPDFIKRYPNCKLDIKLVDNPADYLKDNNNYFDITIYGYIPELGIPSYPLVAKKLLQTPVGIYATPAYLKNNGCPKTPHDLLTHNCISPLKILWPFSGKDKKIFRLSVDGNFKINHDPMIKSLVMHDCAVCYAYPLLFSDELKQGKVVQILSEYTNLYFQMIALYPQSKYIPLKNKVFIEAIQTYYQSIQEDVMQSGQSTTAIT